MPGPTRRTSPRISSLPAALLGAAFCGLTLALRAGVGSEAAPVAPPAEQVYRNTNYGFQFAVPAGWTVRETSFCVAHSGLVFLTVNNQRPQLEVRDWPIGTNAMGFGAATTFQQMQPGEVYVSFGYSGGPGPDTMRADTVGTNLHSLLTGKGITPSAQPGLACLGLGFFKRGYWWAISADLRDPVTEESRDQVMALLRSFEFLPDPVGNGAWAESLAWEQLPETIRASGAGPGWPVASSAGDQASSASFGPQSVVVQRRGSAWSVKFLWEAIGAWEYSVAASGQVTQPQPPVAYPVSLPALRLPSDLPGQSQGRVGACWLAPGVLAAKALGKTTVTWLAPDGSVKRQVAEAEDVGPGRGFLGARGQRAAQGINEDWRITPRPPTAGAFGGHITSTPDSRVFLDQFSPQPGWVSLDIYVHGQRVNTIGPFLPCYPSTDAVLNDDGSAALLVWKSAAKTNAQIVVCGTNGTVQFQTDCGGPFYSPNVAPDGAGVLLRPNTGGSNQNTFVWFTGQGRQRAVDISPNPECVGWIPQSRQSLFWTSLGNDASRFQLIDWDTGTRLWDIPWPGTGEPLAIALTPRLILFAVAEPCQPATPESGKQWLRTFYAVGVRNGAVLARWQAQLPHRSLERWSDYFLRLGSKLFYVTADECAELNLEAVFSKTHGWR